MNKIASQFDSRQSSENSLIKVLELAVMYIYVVYQMIKKPFND